MNSQEAITLLRNLEDALDSYCELNEEGKNAFRMAITALNSSESPNGWIPTSKERPPQHQDIWITSDLGDVELVYGKDGIWWLDESYYTEPEIIAWMPASVPEPYQEVKE